MKVKKPLFRTQPLKGGDMLRIGCALTYRTLLARLNAESPAAETEEAEKC